MTCCLQRKCFKLKLHRDKTNQSKAELQDQLSGKSPSAFLKLLLQVCAKSVDDHEPVTVGTESVVSRASGSFTCYCDENAAVSLLIWCFLSSSFQDINTIKK